MFFEVFAASALANILFSGIGNGQKDYDGKFDCLNYRLNNIDSSLNNIDKKIDQVFDSTRFMRARMCLQEFSPILLDRVKLTGNCHTPEEIMKAAREGFDLLLDIAKADENNFMEARRIFNQTYGNLEWVTEKYHKDCEDFMKLAAEVEVQENKINEGLEQIYVEFSKLATDMANNMPKNKVAKFFMMNRYLNKCHIKLKNFFNNTISVSWYAGLNRETSVNGVMFDLIEFGCNYTTVNGVEFNLRDIATKYFDTHHADNINIVAFLNYCIALRLSPTRLSPTARYGYYNCFDTDFRGSKTHQLNSISKFLTAMK